MGNHYTILSMDERTQIQLLRDQGSSCRAIARQLDRQPSTVTRELRRNGGRGYVAHVAHRRGAGRRARPLLRKLGPCLDTPLGVRVREELRHAWSPERDRDRWMNLRKANSEENRRSRAGFFNKLL
jgi:IS30 family transposase